MNERYRRCKEKILTIQNQMNDGITNGVNEF